MVNSFDYNDEVDTLAKKILADYGNNWEDNLNDTVGNSYPLFCGHVHNLYDILKYCSDNADSEAVLAMQGNFESVEDIIRAGAYSALCYDVFLTASLLFTENIKAA